MCCRRGLGAIGKPPKTRNRHLMFKPPLRRRLEAAGVTTGQGKALSYRAFPLVKQSTGLFYNSPFAVRLTFRCSAVCGRRQGRCP